MLQGNPVITLFVGAQGKKVAYAMNSAIADYAKNGCNVIVDYIAYDKAWFQTCKANYQASAPIILAVDIPLEILEQREKARGTSPVGHARSHFKTVYGDISYNLWVNSEKDTPDQIAQQIKELVEKAKPQ